MSLHLFSSSLWLCWGSAPSHCRNKAAVACGSEKHRDLRFSTQPIAEHLESVFVPTRCEEIVGTTLSRGLDGARLLPVLLLFPPHHTGGCLVLGPLGAEQAGMGIKGRVNSIQVRGTKNLLTTGTQDKNSHS